MNIDKKGRIRLSGRYGAANRPTGTTRLNVSVTRTRFVVFSPVRLVYVNLGRGTDRENQRSRSILAW